MTADTVVAMLTAVGSSGGITLLLYFLGRSRERRRDEVAVEAQQIVNEVSLRTAEQKTIDQLMTRVTNLESWQERAAVKIEALSTDKVRLEAEKYILQQRVVELEVLLERFKRDAVEYQAAIADLQSRLAATRESLRSTEERLVKYEALPGSLIDTEKRLYKLSEE
jgi:chromosome segregation ATPase